ncbi:hypothetical protein TNCV_1738271 [Trichonephila clavipes]|nr:hypothetical protein TNCV_1738271 [Trichonephila clavipes]
MKRISDAEQSINLPESQIQRPTPGGSTQGYIKLLKQKRQERETMVRELQNLPPCNNPDWPDHCSALAESVNYNSTKNSQTAELKNRKTNTRKNKAQRLQSCQVIYSQFGLAIHQNDYQARRRFVEWAQNEIAVVPDFDKRILFSDEAHFWLNGYVNKQNCRIWSEANPQVYVETPLHPEKLTVWCALWAGGILLQKR